MELPDGLLDEPVPAAPYPLPAPPLADGILPARLASDASDAVLPDVAGDEPRALPELADALYAEKLVDPAPDVLEPVVMPYLAPKFLKKPLPERAWALCKPAADRSAA
jgi:hypothetical protein